MKKNSMRLLGFLLAAVMMVSLFGLAVFAGDTANDVNDAAGNVDAQSSEADLLIGTADELKAFSAAVNAGDSFAGKVVKLTADIDLYELGEGGEPVSFTPIGKVSATPFEGTFDGQGHTIENLYQSGWAFGYEWGKYGSLGLFGNINDATVKNLTLTGAECLVEGGDVAGITGSATGTCVFENITITDSVFATYNNGCASIIAWSGAGDYTFKNITIASDVTLAGLWGSFDSSIGGVVGQAEPGASYDFEDVYIACRVDAYNDCTASYDYYNYRMCGMIIGRLEETTTIDGTNYPDTSKYSITCTDVTVKYGNWMRYHYCEPTPSDMNGGRGMRVEAGYAYDGLPADYDHSQCTINHMNLIPFDQLLGGAQIGVKGLPTFEGVTVIYPTEVAQIGDVKYWTLADAILFAQPGDTITLLTDVTEDVTINKALTLDGADKTYTGKMTVTADITIKNVNFDGKGYNGYAVETRSANTVVIEDCTAKDVYGFLQVASNNDSTTIKNVEITGVSYGVKIDHSNVVVLDNVDISATTAALLNSNYGEKTITVKDSYLSILGTWTRNNTTKTTIVFEGDNTVDKFIVDETVDIFKLADVNSTLAAPNDVTVVTDVEDYEVVYENGSYKLAEAKKVYVAQIGDVQYETLADAIAAANAAENGATITLLADATVGEMMTIAKDVIIEGNNNTITWADGYNGTLINVENGVSVTLNKLNIFGDNTFSFYNDTTTVEDGQNWYTRFVDVGEEDKAINANVIVNAGDLTLNRVTIAGVTIASDGDNGKTANTETGGYYLMYNDDLALIKSNGGTVALNDTRIDNNAGLILNAINAKTEISGTGITNNMGAGNKGGIIIANGGTMSIKDTSIDRNKAMARSATILGVINGAEVSFNGLSTMDNNKHIGVGSNTAGAMIVLEGASQFVMNGGSISNNIGGRAGAIASRWVGGNYGQHEDTSIVLNAGTIKGNTASNDSWNGASVFLRSPATIGEGMKIDGTIAVNAAPGALEITGGTFNNFDMIVTDGLTAEITGGTFDSDPTEWVAEGYESIDNGDGTYSVIPTKLALVEVEIMPGFWGTSYITVENWADLVAALGENTNVPVKVTLLENIKLTDEVLTIAGTAKKVIDLNGKRITGTFTEETTAFVYVTGGCELTILDSTVTEVDGFTAGGIHAINTNGNLSNLIRVETDGKLVIESGSYSQDASVNGAGMIDSRGDEIITIKGGHFRLYNVGSAENGSPWIFNASSQNTKNIIVLGGTYNADIIHQYYPFEVMAPKELALVQGEDGIWHFVPAVAYVNEQEWSSNWYTNEVGYATLEDAIAAVEGIRTKNGKTSAEEFITLLADAVVTGDVDTKGITIEQNGFAIKLAAGATLTAPEGLNVTTDVANRKVVYENGVYKLAVITYAAQIGDTLYETIQDAVYAAQDGDTIIVLVDHEMNCADAVANTSGYAVLVNVANQAVTIDLNGKVITVNVDQDAEIYGIFATDTNGKLTLMDSSADKTGKVEITAPGYLYSVLFAYGADSKLTVNGGRYVADAVADSLIYSQHNEIVEINDGYFYLGNVGTGSNGKPWIFNAKGQNTAHAIVKGGTFNADIIHQYYPFEVSAPKELALVEGEDGIWHFVPAVAYVNEQEWSSKWYTNEVGYATLEDAIAAVEGIRTKSGQTSAEEFITLLADVMVTGNVDATGIKIEDNGFAIKLATVDATLTAAEGLNVTTDLEGYKVVYEEGTYKVSQVVIAEIFFSAFGGSETSVTYPGYANSLQELVDYYMLCNNANETAIPGLSAGDYTPVLVIYGGLSAEDVAYLGGASTDGTYVSAKPMTWTVRFANGVDADENVKAAEGYVKIDNGDGTITIQKAVAQVGDTYFATLQDAFAACTNGETITLLVDLTYGDDDVVAAIGGATGFGNYYNPSIIYIGGTKGATKAENQPSNVNAVLDLNGHTITNNADAYLFLFMDNCKVTIKDSKDGAGIIGNTEAPVIWVTGTDTLVTIESGKYTTANAEGLLWSTHGGDLVIKGGEFSTSADDASLLIIRNAQDRRNPNYFIDGKATVTIYGGTFYGFDPEKMMDDSTNPFTEFDACADGYKSIKNGNAYIVENYIEWIKQQLLLGNDVVLEKDIVVDGSMIESIPAPTNGNGKYPNYGIFNVVGDYDVTFDLNGHSITYNGHESFEWNGKTVNSCTVAHGLFYANAGAHLTVKDSVGTGTVTVYGLASGAYVASPDTTFTITGGTWKNYGCAECGGTNIFLYPLQGGELYIEGGYFEQALDANGDSYLLVLHGGEYANSVIDYAKTKLVVTGGTFVGMNPNQARYFYQDADNKTDMSQTANVVALGYAVVDNGNGVWTVVDAVAHINGIGYATLADAFAAAVDGDVITLLKDVTLSETVLTKTEGAITLDLGGYTITTENSINPAIRVLTDLTVKNGTMDTEAYCFIVGGTVDDEVVAGNLTIVDGTYHGGTSVASVTKGTLTVLGGDFSVEPYEGRYDYTLNCIDANYKDGTASIVVKGGTFYKFNPENNASEGVGTNYVPVEYMATADGDNYVVTEWNYEIWDWDDLKKLDAIVEGGNMLEGVTVKLMADINLYEMGEGGEPVTFNPIGANKSYFKGTFDGQGHTIKNMYQSGWALGYDWYNYGTIGLFAYLWDATVKNLTIENAECFVEGGNVAAIAGCAWGDCTFENITVRNSTFATYNNRAGGIVGYTGGTGTFTFKDVTVDENTVIAGLWGSFDSSMGGIMGQLQSDSKAVFENVRVACRIDAYNDVTASYKYYAYRMCGMLIGRVPVDANNKPILDNVTFVRDDNGNETTFVNFGDWAHYTYLWDDSLSRGCQRVEAGYAYDGIDVTKYPDADITHLPFTSLFGGQQYGSYGQAEHEDVIINYPYEAAINGINYWTLADAFAAAKDGDTIVVLRDLDVYDELVVSLKAEETAKSITLDLNGKTLNAVRIYPVIRVQDGNTLTITGNGAVVNATDYVFVLGSSDQTTAGNLVIENGTFEGLTTVASVTKGALTIKGGEFKTAEGEYGATYLLNCIDANYKDGTASIVVKGGRFYGFNPENNAAEGEGTNFVPMGYRASVYGRIDDVDVYDVVELKATVEAGGITSFFPGVENIDNVQELANYYFLMQNAMGWILGYDYEPVLTLFAELTDEVVLGNTPSDDTTVTLPETVTWTIVTNGFNADLIKAAKGYAKVDNGDGTITIQKAVAKIGDTYFATLAAAIQAAQPGDTITLLADVTEDVTVNKSVTIDGDGFKYTGNIAVSGNSTAATVKNVNFVDGTGYAITTNRINSITVENCTVTNYGYGFLYANKTTPTVVVKNVTVDGGNYGFHWVYGTTATLENVTVTNAKYGLYIQNYAGKTINLKNCDISSIVVLERSGYSGVQTFKFEGENKVGALSASQYAKYVLVNADATLTAPEGYDVTTTVVGSTVKYADGTYKVVKAVAQNATTGEIFGSIQDAIDMADSGDTIVVLVDIDLTNTELQVLDGRHDTYFLVENKSITIDLNEKVISGEYTGSRLIGVFSTDKNGALTLTGNGTVEVTATNEVYSLIVAYNDGSSIVIENGTYKLDKASDSLIFYGGYTDAAVTVKGGTFELGNVGIGENGKPWIFNVLGAGDHHVFITGGTFNADVNRQHWANEAVVAETCYMVKNEDGTWTVKDGAVAYVATGMLTGPYFFRKNVGYATIEEAFAAAVEYDDVNITLLQNVTLTKDVEISIPGIVLNANGYALDCNGHEIKLTAIDATLAAPEGYTVTTDLDHCKVVYEDGVYKVALKGVVVLKTEGSDELKYFDTIAAAMAEARNTDATDTVYLIADHEESIVIIYDGTTLDLQSYTLEADYVVGFNGGYLTGNTYKLDSNAYGRLVVAKNNVILGQDAFSNGKANVIPVWDKDEDGEDHDGAYIFSQVLIYTEPTSKNPDRHVTYDSATNSFDAKFKVQMSSSLMDPEQGVMVTDTYADHGVSIIVRSTWVDDQGVKVQDYHFNDEFVQKCSAYGPGVKSYDLTFSINVGDRQNFTLTILVVTDAGTVVSTATYPATSQS